MIDDIRRWLARVLPDLGVRSIVVLGEGADHVAYDVDGHLIVRHAKDDDSDGRATAARREAELLAVVAEWSTLAAPEVLATDPAAGLVVYRKVPGVPLLEHPVAEPERLAPALGAFLSRLHQTPLARVDGLVDHDTYPLSSYRADAVRDYQSVRDLLPAAECAVVEDFLDRPPPDEPARAVFCHNDLGAEHVLVDPESSELTGVIDWSDAAVTDPARDLALLYRDLGSAVHDRVLAHYDQPWSDGDTQRAIFLARCALLEDIAYGARTGAHAYADAGLANLRRTFATSAR